MSFSWLTNSLSADANVVLRILLTKFHVCLFLLFVPDPAISLLQMLIHPMNAFPWVINGIVEANVSKGRLEKLLLPAFTDGCASSPGEGDSAAGAARWENRASAFFLGEWQPPRF